MNDVTLLLVRCILGALMVVHGVRKLARLGGAPGLAGTAASFAGIGIPLPRIAALLAGVTQLVGGAGLVFGSFTSLAAALVSLNMGFAAWVVRGRGLLGGIELPLVYLLAALAISAKPGRWSVDMWLLPSDLGATSGPVLSAAAAIVGLLGALLVVRPPVPQTVVA
ncbi:DoxX family protein [Nocardia sp. NPDC050408]|uniref:DoxX family protein n=1 Tax=Nocardia sp. NPDC050408 TaxID=3364319 RepID=UPI003787BECA